MTSWLEIHDAAGVVLGELDHVLLDELPYTVTAAVIFTKLQGDPRKLRDKPAQTVLHRRVSRDPS